MRMQLQVSSYRIWFFFFNGVLIALQILFIFIFWHITFVESWWSTFFPLERIKFLITFSLVSISLQFFTCTCGIFGVIFSSQYVIRFYWLLMLIQIACDTLQVILWAFAFAGIHKSYESELPRLFESRMLDSESLDLACGEWYKVQESFSCCAPQVVMQNCRNWHGKCNLESVANCHFGLLRWLHSNTDILIILLYLIIFPIKCFSVCALRKDIQELFDEILYTGNRDLYTNWLVVEERESYSSQQTTPLSSPNEYSLISGFGQNGSLRK